MSRSVLAVTVLLGLLAPLYAQESAAEPSSGDSREETRSEREEFETDRSAFTPANSTVSPGQWLVETSYSYLDLRRGPGVHSYPELLVRFGLTDRFELRFGYNLEMGGAEGAEEGTVVAGSLLSVGEPQLLYGFKFRLTEQAGWIPRSGIIAQGYTPTERTNANTTEMAVGYLLGWELPNRWRLDGGVRYATNRKKEDGFGFWAASTVLRIPITEKLGSHLEYFGLFSQAEEKDVVRHHISPGVTYLVTPNCELGVRVGAGLNDQSTSFFANVGFGLRF